MPDDGGLDTTIPEQPLAIPPPERAATEHVGNWSLVEHNRRVLDGWRLICQQIPENAKRCYDWLSTDPTKRIPGRCYELKYKNYAGAWGYEIGSGQRVYYKPRPERRDVLIYYAGPHPKKGVPYPPAEDSN
jgi:hypothetical protein